MFGMDREHFTDINSWRNIYVVRVSKKHYQSLGEVWAGGGWSVEVWAPRATSGLDRARERGLAIGPVLDTTATTQRISRSSSFTYSPDSPQVKKQI